VTIKLHVFDIFPLTVASNLH